MKIRQDTRAPFMQKGKKVLLNFLLFVLFLFFFTFCHSHLAYLSTVLSAPACFHTACNAKKVKRTPIKKRKREREPSKAFKSARYRSRLFFRARINARARAAMYRAKSDRAYYRQVWKSESQLQTRIFHSSFVRFPLLCRVLALP